jgi:hypothetical protein
MLREGFIPDLDLVCNVSGDGRENETDVFSDSTPDVPTDPGHESYIASSSEYLFNIIA